MRRLRLGGTGIETSALGFGCADLLREPSSRGRRRLLDAALDAGIRHFDVAPMYGLGLAEGELGRFALGRRDRGRDRDEVRDRADPAARLLARSGTGSTAPRRVPGPARAGAAAGRRPRRRQRRQAPLPARLRRRRGPQRASSEACSALRTDHVDILFVHDPLPREVGIGRACASYLESARSTGLHPGLGRRRRARSTLAAAARLGPDIPVLQLRRRVLDAGRADEPTVERQATIRFGVIGRALPTDPRARPRGRGHAPSLERGTRRRLRRCRCVASLLLREAIDGDPSGPVLFSTIHADRIAAAARAADGPTDASRLERFRAPGRGRAGATSRSRRDRRCALGRLGAPRRPRDRRRRPGRNRHCARARGRRLRCAPASRAAVRAHDPRAQALGDAAALDRGPPCARCRWRRGGGSAAPRRSGAAAASRTTRSTSTAARGSRAHVAGELRGAHPVLPARLRLVRRAAAPSSTRPRRVAPSVDRARRCRTERCDPRRLERWSLPTDFGREYRDRLRDVARGSGSSPARPARRSSLRQRRSRRRPPRLPDARGDAS